MELNLCSQVTKLDSSEYWVGISDETKVFISMFNDGRDENDYKKFLKIKASSTEEAKQIVIMEILKGNIKIITDRLWAWR